MAEQIFEPLPKTEVIKAVERRNPTRIPLVMARWWGEGLTEQYGDRLRQLDRYPEDAVMVTADSMPFGQMGLSWYDPQQAAKALDARAVLPDWKHLDEFIDKMPDPDRPGLFDDLKRQADQHRKTDRYVLFTLWNLFFEKPWVIRGMENLMLDYYEHPEEVHRLHDALCRNYVGLIRRAKRELQPDGFWTSDDLGNQRQLMMKPDHFREFLKPYYCRVGDACRETGLHFWLHSCGDNSTALDDLIDAGLDVFHPVQKHTMDERQTAKRFGGRLAFLAGFDVQHILQEGTPDDVRAEVRFLIDTFDRPDGGMALAAGNGIVAGTPFENIEAFLDEAVRYGAQHRRQFNP